MLLFFIEPSTSACSMSAFPFESDTAIGISAGRPSNLPEPRASKVTLTKVDHFLHFDTLRWIQ